MEFKIAVNVAVGVALDVGVAVAVACAGAVAWTCSLSSVGFKGTCAVLCARSQGHRATPSRRSPQAWPQGETGRLPPCADQRGRSGGGMCGIVPSYTPPPITYCLHSMS